ncbi:MAG TPA: ABC transporter ATP-binding protein [Steroidobacteraceae bacterium]|nr:ABC transporter ATP-binding protein [Steroidobacteraceae bacterium]
MSITLDQVTKHYQGVPVVNDVSLDVREGEFFVLLGPSGSGKSTLLRAIAGLTNVDHGRISLHGRDVTNVSARQRGVGLVFQNYALFRHMTVAENIEFALRVRRMRARDRRERRKELLRLVALEGLDDRLPTQLSGGQQQRIAVARALAHKPEVLLLDEPFGALDAKIREELRRTIRQVQRELKISTVLVTHDQQEAFALADRIGVMNLGRLLETAPPDELYARPATRFVATFLGAANLLLARQTPDGIRFGAAPVDVPGAERIDGRREHEVVAVLRPEEAELAPTPEALASPYIAQGTVDEIVFTGALERLRIRLSDGAATQLVGPENNPDAGMLEASRTQREQRVFPLERGQGVAIGMRRIHVLPTPLSSYTAFGATAPEAEQLSRHPFLVDLASRMRTRINICVEPELSTRSSEVSTGCAERGGVAVLAATPAAVGQVEWLFHQGVDEALLLPPPPTNPQRVLIHWLDRTARSGTMAVAASLLRHVAAEAVYVGIMPASTPDSHRSLGMRALLDARSEAQAMHSLDMRTELRFGDIAAELAVQLRDAREQMLILGISEIRQIRERFGAVFAAAPSAPILVVYRSGADARRA